MKSKSTKNKRSYMAKKQRDLAANVRDIGPTPACKHPKVRESFSKDLRSFCENYFREIFKMQWSDDHLRVISKLEDVILNGGLYLICCPRGFGKSSLVEIAALWSLLYAHRRFVVPIAATDAAAKGMLESIQVTLETNEKLMEDFPEVCHSITSLDHVSQRASGQLSEGEPTRLEFSKKRIVFASLKDNKGKMSKVAGSILEPKGLTSAIRGTKHKKADGSIIRPDLILLDDIQTRESADSPTQCDERMKLINSDVLGLAGPGKKISGVALGTVIRKGDAIDMLLNDDNPAWQGDVMKLVYKWPDTQETMWAEYAATRRDEQLSGETKHMRSNEFYKANFEAMNTGAKVQWPQRHNDDELSALQHAENLLLDRGEESFYCEYQNEPKRGKESIYELSRETVLQRLNGLPQYQIPETAHFITVMCDINQIGIHYCAVAFDNNMTASIIHYGKYPAENNTYLWRADDPRGLSEAQAIYKGIVEVCKLFSTPRFSKADRKPLKQNIILIDCGYMTDTVFLAVNSLKNQINISCSRGRASKAYKQSKTIGRPGDNWHLAEWAGKGRVLIHNSDYWRHHAQRAFLLPSGAPGSCSLYGMDPKPHLKIASHITAERLEELVHGDTCDFYNWSKIPGESNDLLDCLVGCFVGASALGLNISGGEQSWRQRKPKYVETRKPKVPINED